MRRVQPPDPKGTFLPSIPPRHSDLRLASSAVTTGRGVRASVASRGGASTQTGAPSIRRVRGRDTSQRRAPHAWVAGCGHGSVSTTARRDAESAPRGTLAGGVCRCERRALVVSCCGSTRVREHRAFARAGSQGQGQTHQRGSAAAFGLLPRVSWHRIVRSPSGRPAGWMIKGGSGGTGRAAVPPVMWTTTRRAPRDTVRGLGGVRSYG